MSYSNIYMYPVNNYTQYFYPEKTMNMFKASLLKFDKKYKISK